MPGVVVRAARGGGALCRTGLKRARHVIPSSQRIKLVTHERSSVCNEIAFSEQTARAGWGLMLQLTLCALVLRAWGVQWRAEVSESEGCWGAVSAAVIVRRKKQSQLTRNLL